MDNLLNVIKKIFCEDNYNEECNKCSLCHLIDVNNLPSLIIIEPDGNNIKKEQIIELKNKFSKDSQYTKENIYIIKNCEKMNKESANTMLKFLEEPQGNVIGFFITSHIDNVMLTIQSRCQHIEAFYENTQNEKFDINIESYNNYYEIIKSYIRSIELEKKELIIYNKKYFVNLEKEDIKLIFKIILDIYEDVLQNKILNNHLKEDFNFLNSYSFNNIKRKIKLIIEILKELNYNINIDLILDRFVLEMDGINNEVV